MENEIFNETKVSKAYFRLSLPLVLSMVVTLIYNLADTFSWHELSTQILLPEYLLECPCLHSLWR